jgi:hypothetical protein
MALNAGLGVSFNNMADWKAISEDQGYRAKACVRNVETSLRIFMRFICSISPGM